MKIYSTLILLLTISLSATLTSCARAPEEKIQVVTTAFQDLETMNAEGYAPQAFDQAEKAYADAMAELEAQNGTFFLNRSYTLANDLLAKAKEALEKAKEEAETAREVMQQDADTLIENAKQAFATAEDAMGELQLPSARMEPIRKVYEDAGGTLKAAEDAFESGDFLKLLNKTSLSLPFIPSTRGYGEVRPDSTLLGH
jgi:hypothetical protein